MQVQVSFWNLLCCCTTSKHLLNHVLYLSSLQSRFFVLWRKRHFGLMICLVSRQVLWLQELHNKHLLVQWFFSSYFLFWTQEQIKPPKHFTWAAEYSHFTLVELSVFSFFLFLQLNKHVAAPGPLHLTVHLEETVFPQRATFLTATSLLDLWSNTPISENAYLKHQTLCTHDSLTGYWNFHSSV